MSATRVTFICSTVGVLLAVLVPAHAGTSQEAPFLAEAEAAMNKMMAGMDIKPTGDVDHDFVAMMIPHHQGAVDMAKAFLLHGKDPALRRLAGEIIVTQGQEIDVMRLRLAALEAAQPASTRQARREATRGRNSFVTPAQNLRRTLLRLLKLTFPNWWWFRRVHALMKLPPRGSNRTSCS